MGQPGTNPSRRSDWARPYFSGVDKGLLVPVAAPVYAGDRFLGVLAIDMRLDALDPIHAAMGYALGTVALVDAQGRVLAHPAPSPESYRLRSPARFEFPFASQALAPPPALAAIVIRRPLASAGRGRTSVSVR